MLDKIYKKISKNYLSCSYIENGIHFDKDSIHFCCIIHSGNKGNVNICDFSGGNLPVRAIKNKRIKIIRDNQIMNRDTPCQGCPLLVEKKWANNHTDFSNISIAHYLMCNLKCKYCYMAKKWQEWIIKNLEQPYDVSLVIENMLEKGLVSKNAHILFAGGEPTLYTEFENILKLALENEIFITLLSNCTKFKESVRYSLARKKMLLICSVDAGTKQTYHSVKGRDRFDTVWNNLERYAAESKELVQVKYIFLDENCSKFEVKSFIKECIKRGIINISISCDFTKNGENFKNEDGNYFPENVSVGMAYMVYLAKQNHLRYDFSPISFNKESIEEIERSYDRLFGGVIKSEFVNEWQQAVDYHDF